MTDLLEWAAGFQIPYSLDAKSRKAKLTAATLPAPTECRTDHVQVRLGWRRPNGGSIAIDGGWVTTDRRGYRALALLMMSHVLSEQQAPLRLHLPADPDEKNDVHQIVLWPSAESAVERMARFRFGPVREIHYRPKLLEENPNYTTWEQDDEDYPREHLPLVTLGPSDWKDGYPFQHPELPLCLHLAGTSASLVWLAKFLLDVSLEESNCRRCYLYNTLPSESLAVGSAELHLDFTDPSPVRPADSPAESADESEAAGED